MPFLSRLRSSFARKPKQSTPPRRAFLEPLESRRVLAFYPAAGSPVPAGDGASNIAVIDLNHDGHLDLATANERANSVGVLLGDGSGGFAAALGSPVAAGDGSYSVAAADLNSDGHPDLATANFADGDVSVLLGDGMGGFSAAPGSPVAVELNPSFIAIADLNADGYSDLVTANRGFGSISVLLGNGNGGFANAADSPLLIGYGTGPNSVAIADVNGDSFVDLVTANLWGQSLSIFLGDGTGGFTGAASSPMAVPEYPLIVTAADLNEDGRIDLVTKHLNSIVSIMLGDGAGSFSAAEESPLTVSASLGSLAVADLNDDHHLDLAITNYDRHHVDLLLGDSAGRFTPASGSPVSTGNNPFGVVVADVNGDGRADLVTANIGSDNVSVLLNDDAPAFTTSPIIEAIEDNSYIYNIAVSDPNDGDSLTITAPTLPDWLTLIDHGDGTATLGGTPNDGDGGPHEVVLHVNDGIADPVAQSFTITVMSVNDAPSGTNRTLSLAEDTTRTFTAANFGFQDTVDVPSNEFLAVKITTLPAAGLLQLGDVAVASGQFVSTADVNAGLLTFTPTANTNGSPYASFTFQVQDDGGTNHGGVDLDPSPNTITLSVWAVNDRPEITGLSEAVTFTEDGPHTAIAGAAASIKDIDSANLEDGNLTVWFSAGRRAEDRLFIRNNPAGVSTNVNNQVLYKGTPIGTFSGGTGSDPLVITFDANCHAGLASVVLRNILYRAASHKPAENDRTVRMRVTDGDGGVSLAASTTLHVVAVNDPPALSGIEGSIGYKLNSSAAVSLANQAILKDLDSQNFNTGKLIVEITSGSDPGNRLLISGTLFVIDGTNVVRKDATGGDKVIGIINTDGGVGTTKLEFTFNENALVGYVQQLIRAIRFRTIDSTSTMPRLVSFTVSDDKGDVSETLSKTVSIT